MKQKHMTYYLSKSSFGYLKYFTNFKKHMTMSVQTMSFCRINYNKIQWVYQLVIWLFSLLQWWWIDASWEMSYI